jgi:competence protein ComEC
VFVAGGLWLALQRGSSRLWGLAPMAVGSIGLAVLSPPDILIGRDGRHVAVVELGQALRVFGGSPTGYGRGVLAETAGLAPETTTEANQSCGSDFCAISVNRAARRWTLLIAKSDYPVPADQLQRACAAADIVIADRRLPEICRPRWLKADGSMLSRSGGLAIDLDHGRVITVAQSAGAHPWWQYRGDQ